MANTKQLIEKYNDIMKILKKYGFQEAIIFKGFSVAEEHNLNLWIRDQYNAASEPSPQTTRALYLSDKLTSLLGCEIIITIDKEMEPFFGNKLDESNSVRLTESIPSKEIESVFGSEWKFNQYQSQCIFYTPLIKNNSAANTLPSTNSDNCLITTEKDVSHTKPLIPRIKSF